MDISEKFLKHIESTAQEQGLKNITGVVCKQDSVNLPPNSIDLAFICDTYHHFEFPHKTMESIHRALKPGGQLILIDFHRIEGVSREWLMTHVRAGQEVFTQEILESGFKQVDEKKKMLDESYFVRFEKTSTPELKLLLSGTGESELAPHGKGNIYAPDVMVDDGFLGHGKGRLLAGVWLRSGWHKNAPMPKVNPTRVESPLLSPGIARPSARLPPIRPG